MDVVFVSPDLNERYLVAFTDFQTRLFELLVNVRAKDYPPILGRADDVIQQH